MSSVSLPSVLRGEAKCLSQRDEPIQLHRILEHTVRQLGNLKHGSEAVQPIHSIKVSDEVSQDTALIYRNSTISFHQLNELANRLARAYLSSMRKEDYQNSDGDVVVAICVEPSDALVIALLACWKMGAAYLPINPTFPISRIQHIIEESNPALVVINRSDRSIFPGSNVVDMESLQESALTMSSEDLTDAECKAPKVPVEDLIAIVLYTSGSTGTPKGVRIKHSSILNRLKWQWERFPYSNTEKIGIFKTALTFVDSVSEIWGPLLNARTLLIAPNEDAKDAERILNLLEQYQVERLVLVPTLLQSILLYLNSSRENNVCDKRLSRLRLWVCSGETLSSDLVQQFYSYFSPRDHSLCNFYGSTEVMGDVTYYVIENPDEAVSEGRVPIGSPVNNSAVYLLDDKLNPVKTGEIGELYASGLNLAGGYVRNRDTNRFVDNNIIMDSGHGKLYRTGDYGIIRNNVVYFEGRTDSQIKIRGHRVDLSEVEAALKKVEEIKQSVVIAHNPGQQDQALLAFVTLDGDEEKIMIENKLLQLLPNYMVPRVIVVDTIPLLVNGKVDRQSLLKMYRDGALKEDDIVDYEGVEPEFLERAKAVFSTAVAILGHNLRDRITANGNFFHLGGNSLNSVYFVTKLRDMGYHISLRDFLRSSKFMDVIVKMKDSHRDASLLDDSATEEILGRYKIEMLSESTKSEFKEVICRSFHEKADLEGYLETNVPYSHYEEVIDALWDEIVEAKLSFVARNKEGNIVGAAINKDAHMESHAEISPENKLNIVFEFLDHLEVPLLEERFPKGNGKILHNFMMGSSSSLSTQETIELFIYMEGQIMQIAKSLGFTGVFTTNTSPLTQQLSKDLNNYETLLDYQPNQYVASDGTKPFTRAPDSLRTLVCWKSL